MAGRRFVLPFCPPARIAGCIAPRSPPHDCLSGIPPILKSDVSPFPADALFGTAGRGFRWAQLSFGFPHAESVDGVRGSIDDVKAMLNSLDLEGRPEDTRIVVETAFKV